MTPTLQEKYDFLCDTLRIWGVDHLEQDALIRLKSDLYFQFSGTPPTDIDTAIILAMEQQ